MATLGFAIQKFRPILIDWLITAFLMNWIKSCFTAQVLVVTQLQHFLLLPPGATVVAVQPQATLDPRVTVWDSRHRKMRRADFTSRYGYAPDVLVIAEQA